MPVLSLACHLPHNTPHIPSRYNNEQTTKQTKAINNSYIYINISCKCDTNRAGHFTLDAYASRPVACSLVGRKPKISPVYCGPGLLRHKDISCDVKLTIWVMQNFVSLWIDMQLLVSNNPRRIVPYAINNLVFCNFKCERNLLQVIEFC